MIKILFLAAEPIDSARLRLGQELREIREHLQFSKNREIFSLEYRSSVRAGDITQAIFDIEPQIIHFSGHGTHTGSLCCEDEQGNTHEIVPNALSNLFKLVANNVNCVILNSCFSKIQADAISHHISYVVGMSKAIGDKAAITFSVGFYKALGAGKSFEEAYRFACAEMELQGITENRTPEILINKSRLLIENIKNEQQQSITSSKYTKQPKLSESNGIQFASGNYISQASQYGKSAININNR